jgi:hypothetical protein
LSSNLPLNSLEHLHWPLVISIYWFFVGPIDPHNLKATTSNFTLMVNCEEPIMGPTKNSSKQSHNVNYYVTLLSFYAIPLYNNTVKYMFAISNQYYIVLCQKVTVTNIPSWNNGVTTLADSSQRKVKKLNFEVCHAGQP